MLAVTLMCLERGNFTSDLSTITGLAATDKARRTVVNKVANTMV